MIKKSTKYIAFSILIGLGITANAQQNHARLNSVDTSQVRYVKFSSQLNDNNNYQAEIKELKTFMGGANIAIGKTTHGNNNDNGFEAIDNNINSSWMSNDYGSMFSCLEYGPNGENPHFIQIDLGRKYNLDSLKLDIQSGYSVDQTFDFLISEDAENWTLIDHKERERDIYTYKSIPMLNIRYIKYASYFSNDCGQVNVQEIQAFSADSNVALFKKGFANSYEYGNYSSNGINAVDGNIGSRWSSNRNDHTGTSILPSTVVNFVVDLGDIYRLDSIEIVLGSSTAFYNISVSTDNSNWILLDDRENLTSDYVYKFNKRLITSVLGDTKTTTTIFPNPAINYFAISGIDSNYDITVCNLQGEIVFKNSSVESAQPINISTWNSGLYIVYSTDIKTGQKTTSKLIVK